MANFPIIVCFEASDVTDIQIPIAFSWTLNDGQYKTCTVMPEDDWIDGIDQGRFNIHDLFDFGMSSQDIIKEFTQDWDKQVLYSPDPNWLQDVLSSLFDTIGQEADFDIQPITNLFSINNEQLQRQLQELVAINDWQMHQCEQQLQCWRLLFQQN